MMNPSVGWTSGDHRSGTVFCRGAEGRTLLQWDAGR